MNAILAETLFQESPLFLVVPTSLLALMALVPAAKGYRYRSIAVLMTVPALIFSAFVTILYAYTYISDRIHNRADGSFIVEWFLFGALPLGIGVFTLLVAFIDKKPPTE